MRSIFIAANLIGGTKKPARRAGFFVSMASLEPEVRSAQWQYTLEIKQNAFLIKQSTQV